MRELISGQVILIVFRDMVLPQKNKINQQADYHPAHPEPAAEGLGDNYDNPDYQCGQKTHNCGKRDIAAFDPDISPEFKRSIFLGKPDPQADYRGMRENKSQQRAEGI